MKTIILLLLFSSTFLFSQSDKKEKRSYFDSGDGKSLFEEKKGTEFLPGIQIDPDNFILDKEIDPNSYILGPGDQFDLFIGGLLQKHIPLTVLPDGNLLVPELGAIKVSNLTITEAKQLLHKNLKKMYKTNEIEFILIYMRKFRTFISGLVSKPGTYFLQSSDRVSSIIQSAGGMSGWADPSRIQIRRGDSTLIANLWAFFYRGNLDENPYLHQGDIVYVPSIDLAKPYIRVYSTRGSEQYVPILENEKLKDFLDRRNLINPRSDIEKIEFTRKDSTFFVDISDSKRKEIILHNGDGITIPILRGEVFITGQILKPGPYPYIPDYTAWDYIARAGIIESSDDINDVQVIRFTTKEVVDGADTIVENGDIIFLGRKSREDFKDYINILVPVMTLFVTVYLAFGK